MRIGVLVYGLDRPLTGIGRYTYELVRSLSRQAPAIELVLLCAGGIGPLAGQTDAPCIPLPGCRLLPGLMTAGNILIPAIARRLKLDLVHDPTGVTPMMLGAGPARRVATVHDVFAWSLPGTSSILDTIIYRHWLPRALPSVDAVITVTDHSRQEIMKYLRPPAAKLQIIPYGIAGTFGPLDRVLSQRLVAERYGIHRPFLLYVGALTIRKNIERALAAFAVLRKSYPELCFVIAGPRSWKQTPIEEILGRLGLHADVMLTGPCTDADLPALYSAAELFVFPSLYEGFGLPPLEAMACGTPVVTANVSSLPEVVGDAALTVDPYDVAALAAAIGRALSDQALRAELRARGLARAAQFTWERTARETLAVYRQLLGASAAQAQPSIERIP